MSSMQVHWGGLKAWWFTPARDQPFVTLVASHMLCLPQDHIVFARLVHFLRITNMGRVNILVASWEGQGFVLSHPVAFHLTRD
jgi:hypothetical protein